MAEPGPPDGEGSLTRVLEYGLSHADLARVLPRLLPDTPLEVLADGYRWCPPGAEIRLEPGQEQLRSLGGLRLPWLEIAFTFRGLDAQAIASFQARFDRCFQKGGG